MKILSWNCRGLGQPRTVQELVCLSKTHQPNVIFLSETRKNKEYDEGLRYRLGMKNVVTFSAQGKGGGLAVFWDDAYNLELNKYGEHFIDMFICTANGAKWRSTFIYGEPKASQRYVMWELMRRIKPMGSGTWFMVGDFNEAMWQNEHFSRHKRSSSMMANFRSVLYDCNLFDLGFHGVPWTYNNKQEGNKNVKVRLDRAVACPQWSALFPDCKVSHIISSRSDHFVLYSFNYWGLPVLAKLLNSSDTRFSGRGKGWFWRIKLNLAGTSALIIRI